MGKLKDKRGYVKVWYEGRLVWEHRLIWFKEYGYWPQDQIDHIDKDKSNNSLDNLRLSTRSQNGANREKNKNNTSGFKGVFKNGKKGWMARIKVNYKQKYLGTFKSKEEAAKAYNDAAIEYFGEYAEINPLKALKRMYG